VSRFALNWAIIFIHNKKMEALKSLVILGLYLSIGFTPKVLCKILGFCYKTLRRSGRS